MTIDRKRIGLHVKQRMRVELEEQCLKLRQPWVRNDFIFLASAFEDLWPVFYLAVSSSHQQSYRSFATIEEDITPNYLRDHIRSPFSATSHRPLRSLDRHSSFCSAS